MKKIIISTKEHKHIPIAEIIKGKIQGHVAQKPGSNKCVVCGELLPDMNIVTEMFMKFIDKERGLKTPEW